LKKSILNDKLLEVQYGENGKSEKRFFIMNKQEDESLKSVLPNISQLSGRMEVK
jgi:hypothetical protein